MFSISFFSVPICPCSINFQFLKTSKYNISLILTDVPRIVKIQKEYMPYLKTRKISNFFPRSKHAAFAKKGIISQEILQLAKSRSDLERQIITEEYEKMVAAKKLI